MGPGLTSPPLQPLILMASYYPIRSTSHARPQGRIFAAPHFSGTRSQLLEPATTRTPSRLSIIAIAFLRVGSRARAQAPMAVI
jgi:hypothetical protein